MGHHNLPLYKLLREPTENIQNVYRIYINEIVLVNLEYMQFTTFPNYNQRKNSLR